MSRKLLSVIAIAAALSLATEALSATVEEKHHVTEHHVTHHWRGYGFLPGYRSPEVLERERWKHYHRLYGSQFYGPAWPGYYHGRWNGGGFGPCCTQTPIGPIWSCGR